jgi:hypothetical protein
LKASKTLGKPARKSSRSAKKPRASSTP